MEIQTLGETFKEKIARLSEIVSEDPIGDAIIATAVVAAHFDLYPLAAGSFAAGMYHIKEIDKLQRKKQELLGKAKDDPRLLQRLDNIHTRLERGDLSDQYTAWLYRNLRNKVTGEEE